MKYNTEIFRFAQNDKFAQKNEKAPTLTITE